MNDEVQKNVFISHYGKDDESVQSLKRLLKENGYNLRNSSIDSTKSNEASNENYIKSLLRDGIRWAGNVIVLIGPHTHKRDWVNWEIDQANKQGKSIIGVFLQGAMDSEIPENFEKYGNALVGWNSNKIVNALDGKCSDFDNVNGTSRVVRNRIERGAC